MELDIYQIDAFANKPFEGNPAAVVPLKSWLSETMMQTIAGENNLAETAFFVEESEGYSIRWFTPLAEVSLCGHATLASAYVLFSQNPHLSEIIFRSASGPLHVTKDGAHIVLDFPANPIAEFATPRLLVEALGIEPSSCLKTANGDRYVAVFDSPEQILNANPDMNKLMSLDAKTVGITSTSTDYDFISRFFAPKIGVPEDPVTGSYHTNLIPYWSERLGKTKLNAKQVSPRGGEVFCEARGDRVKMGGKAVQYLSGKIEIPD